VLPQAQWDDVTINGSQLSDGKQIGDDVELTLRAGKHTIVYLLREKESYITS